MVEPQIIVFLLHGSLLPPFNVSFRRGSTLGPGEHQVSTRWAPVFRTLNKMVAQQYFGQNRQIIYLPPMSTNSPQGLMLLQVEFGVSGETPVTNQCFRLTEVHPVLSSVFAKLSTEKKYCTLIMQIHEVYNAVTISCNASCHGTKQPVQRGLASRGQSPPVSEASVN